MIYQSASCLGGAGVREQEGTGLVERAWMAASAGRARGRGEGGGRGIRSCSAPGPLAEDRLQVTSGFLHTMALNCPRGLLLQRIKSARHLD